MCQYAYPFSLELTRNSSSLEYPALAKQLTDPVCPIIRLTGTILKLNSIIYLYSEYLKKI
jgi:hypothetical protein